VAGIFCQTLDSQNVMEYILSMGNAFAGFANGVTRATGFDSIALFLIDHLQDGII